MTSLIALRPSALFSSSSILPIFSPCRSASLRFSFSPPPRRTTVQTLGFSRKKKDAFGSDWSAVDLEAEILEFMDKSDNPHEFPTRAELIAGGRADLAEAVAREGGWLAYGWDLEEEDEEEEEEQKQEDDLRLQNGSLEGDDACSSSARSMGVAAAKVEAVGIEGILNGLEKERSLSYGVGSADNRVNGKELSRNEELNRGGDAGLIVNKKIVGSIDKRSRTTSPDLDEQNFYKFGGMHSQKGSSGDASATSVMPKWRTWSLRRAGNPTTEFEAAEIALNKERHANLNLNDDIFMNASEAAGSVSKIGSGSKGSKTDDVDTGNNQIHLRLKHLESELTSALCSLRSKSEDVVSVKDQESQLKELHRLSDELEFKQTEIMNAKDELRTKQAKLAIQHGKMTHKLTEEQKRLDVIKKRLDAAQKALCLLRSTYIVWPRSASEVLLAGSFDGWTSQRRMERSKSGIFTLHLQLYPGRYEIKFIVDGVWMIDPLRPTVCNNGYENNLLIIP